MLHVSFNWRQHHIPQHVGIDLGIVLEDTIQRGKKDIW